MAEQDVTPQPAPMFHPGNIVGSPVSTVASIALGVGQYLSTQGVAWPHDSQGWIQFVVGLLISVLGSMYKAQPTK